MKKTDKYHRLIEHVSELVKDKKLTWVTVHCPFHRERTPSCILNFTVWKFKCLGCNRSGSLSQVLEKVLFTHEPFRRQLFYVLRQLCDERYKEHGTRGKV